MNDDLSQRVDFNLDTAESDGDDIPPFVFVVGGRRLSLTDPNKVDYRLLVGMEHPIQLFKHVMSEEDLDFFRDQAIPANRLNELAEKFSRHFKLDERRKAGKDSLF